MSETKDEMFKLGGYQNSAEALSAILFAVMKKYPDTNITRLYQTCNRGRRSLVRFYERALHQNIPIIREEEWIFCATLYGELILEAYKQKEQQGEPRRLSAAELLEEFKRTFSFRIPDVDVNAINGLDYNRLPNLFALKRNK